jgi:hypothetical protein
VAWVHLPIICQDRLQWRIRFTENFCGCSLPTSKVCGKRTRKRKDVRSVLADTPPNCYLTRAIHTTTALIVARRDVGGITLGRERGTGLAFKRGAGVFIYPHAWPLGPRAS